MLKNPPEASESIKKRKNATKTIGDNYGITLLPEDRETYQVEDSESSSDEALDQKIELMTKLSSFFEAKGKTTNLPQIDEVKSKWKDLKNHEGLDDMISKHRNSKKVTR
jgi:hypothetical protein